MSTNYSGDGLTDKQIADHAQCLRRHHGLDDMDVPDVVALLERDTILTRFGVKSFDHQVVADEVLGGDEAVTLITYTHVRVRISRTTYERARALDRRARMTIAHEFMHGVLHRNEEPLARARTDRQKRVVAAYVSVERQANVGASAYLITNAMVGASDSPTDLADRAIVSFAAADIRWEQEQIRIHRDDVRSRLIALSEELRNGTKPSESKTIASLKCPGCDEHTLVPIGVKATGIKYICTGQCEGSFDVMDGDGFAA